MCQTDFKKCKDIIISPGQGSVSPMLSQCLAYTLVDINWMNGGSHDSNRDAHGLAGGMRHRKENKFMGKWVNEINRKLKEGESQTANKNLT